MENRSTEIKQSVHQHRPSVKGTYREDLYRTLSNDGCEDFYNYIDWLDIAKNLNVIVLPAVKYFYYIPEDLKNTETVINLKPLNLIKDLRSFLVKIYTFLPEYSYFTGYFEDYSNGKNQSDEKDKYQPGENADKVISGNKQNRHKLSWFYKIINILFNTGIKQRLSKKSARSLLEGVGFTVHDITELNGKKYFCAQKKSAASR
ncbi:MAG: hypothetical protein ACQERS_05340 [Bacteroidota bacterium]